MSRPVWRPSEFILALVAAVSYYTVQARERLGIVGSGAIACGLAAAAAAEPIRTVGSAVIGQNVLGMLLAVVVNLYVKNYALTRK